MQVKARETSCCNGVNRYHCCFIRGAVTVITITENFGRFSVCAFWLVPKYLISLSFSLKQQNKKLL